ncbi:TetR/AcrR family transcriptional regulator [Rhodococcus sp. ACT016]|uniref:TetR/AcrR family transcriptional regulator n=1 Tax=Rhodococcus sp. ACT016 TaxID=3134808 RepID=UPI003D276C14
MLATATELFAENGIRAVGIDRILSESGVAKASLYSSFGSKDALVRAYLEGLDMRDRARWADAIEVVDDPLDRIYTFFDLAAASAPVRNFRGCQYLNAATEFPAVAESILAPVRDHRDWVLERITENLEAAGCARPEEPAARIQLVYDGALARSKFAHSEEPIHRGREMAAELIRIARP